MIRTMKRFVKISAPPDNPDVGKLPEHPPPVEREHPDRIVMADYDPTARRAEWPEHNPGELRPDYEIILRPEVKYYHNNISVWHLGEGYDPTCSLAIDASELFENDSGRVPSGRPGDTYRVSSWASRLLALHIKD